MDGLARHFFHYPSKAYTTGTRKKRKVQFSQMNMVESGDTRWHKTGKTRPILVNGKTKGYKILVLYTNNGSLKKPQKANWVMHQYHLGSQKEKEGELVVSKVFYQTQPRQWRFCTSYRRLRQVEASWCGHQRGCWDCVLLQQKCRISTAIDEGTGTGSSPSEPAPAELRLPNYNGSDF